ncbi:hypothetical protein VW29_02560 [Devosia limi DSM 17137]|uniref:Uncharacterized protein n=1 Tax=Devosia limi DSM 17137 TaxID=1121477 RepID=A0A0F5LW87_9HYPH|nr:hypothetical protein [Devosia limi]KKB86459.1 hypothetical protein VW29_02560 [Devosia limi DSM 17137]SHE88235.1 hypothetical protein SAMN02745223_01310 [Devosia limi DSM 17137]
MSGRKHFGVEAAPRYPNVDLEALADQVGEAAERSGLGVRKLIDELESYTGTEAVKFNITDGDCLVIKCPHVVTRDEAFHLKSAFTALVDNLGVNAKVIILDRGIDIAVLTKGEPERAPGRLTP